MKPERNLDLMYRQLVREWRKMADDLAEALRFHEDRRANPTSRGGPALARYDALIQGLQRIDGKEG